MIRKLILPVLLLISTLCWAQQPQKYADIDARIMKIPKTSTYSVNDIAAYVKANFKTDEEKARAVFYWIAQTISYDVENMNKNKLYDSEQQIVDEVLNNRKGVCAHYATLFSQICNEAGVKAFVVNGFTRSDGIVAKLSHAWNVAFINSKWCFFDPTWGAGGVMNGRFVRKLNNLYFNTKPEDMIISHYPFDPMWQLLQYPVNNVDFIAGKINIDPKKPLFNYTDSILMFEKQSKKDQLTTTIRRMKKGGLSNELLVNEYSMITSRLNIYRKNDMIDFYNSGVEKYNNAVAEFNDFIAYRNNQFRPTKSDAVIKLMLENTENSTAECRRLIDQIVYADPSVESMKNSLEKMLNNLEKAVAEQREFLNKYLSTKKIFRKSLFYKYTWLGIPLN